MPPTPSCLVVVAAPMEANFYPLACGGVCPCSTSGLCSCSTTSSLTCSLPTSSSSISRRPILPRLTASARIARAPIAIAPAALAPTAKAPRPVHASPVATRAKATCAPNLGCSTRLARRILCIALSFLQPKSSVELALTLSTTTMMPLPEARHATSKNSVKAKFGGSTVRWGGFLRQLHCYKSQPLDTDRCNEWYQVGAFWPQRGAAGAIVE